MIVSSNEGTLLTLHCKRSSSSYYRVLRFADRERTRNTVHLRRSTGRAVNRNRDIEAKLPFTYDSRRHIISDFGIRMKNIFGIAAKLERLFETGRGLDVKSAKYSFNPLKTLLWSVCRRHTYVNPN
jgi:hypothetical protein